MARTGPKLKGFGWFASGAQSGCLRGVYIRIMKTYSLMGADGKLYESSTPGTLGGYRPKKICGRLDCPSALRWVEKGHYAKHRVFFKDEPTAVEAGYRPCARCLPERYQVWKSGGSLDVVA